MRKKYFEKCIKCEERYPACQDHCGYGIEQKKEYDAEKALIEKNKEAESVVFDYKHNRISKSLHDKHRRGVKKK